LQGVNLVLEIDRGYHFEAAQPVKDIERQQLLENKGLRFLRFADDEVKKGIDIVLLIN
jgi:very-short-patch-repair endonuclease